MDKLILTAAITGSRITREQTPYIPLTPEEIVAAAVECWNAGAAMVHIHVRDPETGKGTQNLDMFRRVVDPLRAKTDLILCLTTSGIPGRNLPAEERLAPLELRPELASLDAGSINLVGHVFENSPAFLETAAHEMTRRGIKPEIEIFDSGMLVTALRMRDEGILAEPLHFQLVLGTAAGAPATPRSLLHLCDAIPDNATWSVIGIGKAQCAMSTMAMVLGGHVRVGMEDGIYLRRGELARSNAQFVERMVRIARAVEREVADPQAARRILGLNPDEGGR